MSSNNVSIENITLRNERSVSFGAGRAILHIDGDAFFAACEVAKNPALRGKPVITGKERGIVSAATYEAKALGIKRGMTLSEVKKICPEAVILPSDYETYSLFSERMYAIVRRFTPAVEEYSIDECFADLTGLRRSLRMSYPDIAAKIKQQLDQELGMTFSIGVSATKTLAKIGSKWKKPSGLTLIPLREAPTFLKALKVGAIWGIGPQTSALLNAHGVRTAYDFAHKDEAWVHAHVSKPYFETWQELNGVVANELNLTGRETYQSISKTKTFTPPSSDLAFVFAQLSKNVENACIKARRWNLSTPVVFFFLKTQEFRYHGYEVKLPFPTNNPVDVLREIRTYFMKTFKKRTLYRATGITLINLVEEGTTQLDLFGRVAKSEGMKRVFESTDHLAKRYGKHTVYLGSSFTAMSRIGTSGGMQHAAHLGERGDVAKRTQMLFKGESSRRRLNIPMLGEVK